MANRRDAFSRSPRRRTLLWLTAAVVAVAALQAQRSRAEAYPMFARRYGVSCQTCHSVVPRLNPFGERFKAAGYRWPTSGAAHPTLPLTVKSNLAYTSEPDPSGLPKGIVDELEVLSAGPVGRDLSYHLEQYLVDGGTPGKLRDAWVEFDGDPMRAWISGAPHGFALRAQVGQFTLPLPNDPETMRPTESHYAVFDQTVGANPFDLFNDAMGINLSLVAEGAEIHLLALAGHDPQSGLPTDGTDRMATARLGSERLSLFGYRYEGARPLGPVPDEFRRTGWAVRSTMGKSRASALLQTGTDSSADGLGAAVASSGGFAQEEWAFSDRLIAVVRYDGVNAGDAGAARSTTISLVVRPYRRARFTIEDVIVHQPRTTHTLNLGWLFAY